MNSSEPFKFISGLSAKEKTLLLVGIVVVAVLAAPYLGIFSVGTSYRLTEPEQPVRSNVPAELRSRASDAPAIRRAPSKSPPGIKPANSERKTEPPPVDSNTLSEIEELLR